MWYNGIASGGQSLWRSKTMIITSETYKALSIFRALTPHDQDFLIDLAEALLQSQAACDDSTETEK